MAKAVFVTAIHEKPQALLTTYQPGAFGAYKQNFVVFSFIH